MDQGAGFFEGWVGGMIVVFLLVWAMLSFLAPFFWYGTNKRAREISEKWATASAGCPRSRSD